MKDVITLKDVLNIVDTLDFPIAESIGNGLYRLKPCGLICGEKMLEEIMKGPKDLQTILDYTTADGHRIYSIEEAR